MSRILGVCGAILTLELGAPAMMELARSASTGNPSIPQIGFGLLTAAASLATLLIAFEMHTGHWLGETFARERNEREMGVYMVHFRILAAAREKRGFDDAGAPLP